VGKHPTLNSFRGRFFATWGASLIAVAIAAVATLLTVQIVLRAYYDASQDVIRDLNVAQHIETAAFRASRVTSDDVAFSRNADFEQAVLDVQAALSAARRDLATDDEQRLMNPVVEQWGLFVDLSRVVLAAPDRSNPDTLLLSQQRDARMDALIQALGDLNVYFELEVNEAVNKARGQAIRMFITLVLVFAVVCLGALVIGLRFIHSVVLPLNQLEQAAKQYLSGDLDWRVSIRTDDEFGQLGTTFNAMAERLSLTVKRLEGLSRKDGLTGLYNRREFDERLAAELIRARRYNHPVSLLLFDLDRFKLVNDRYGHPTGDAALKYVAARVLSRVRAADVVFRFGGDEFAVLLPETSQADAAILAEGLQETVAVQPLQYNGQPVRLAISVGVGSYPECGLAPEALIAVADASLYAAKASRRERQDPSDST